MPELGPYGSVRGARGNSRPYRESRRGPVKPMRMTHLRLKCSTHALQLFPLGEPSFVFYCLGVYCVGPERGGSV